MYLWNVDALIKDVKENKLSDREQFKYVMAYSLLMMLASDPVIHFGLKYSYIDAISSLILLGITVSGIMLCKRENDAVGGQDFLLRFFTIGLPISIRFIAIALPLGIIVGILSGIASTTTDMEQASESTTSFFEVIFSSGLMMIFYIYYSRKFRRFGISE